MIDKNELCKKITSIYPDIGTCGIDVNVDYSEEKGAYIVDMKKDEHHLQTHLEIDESEQCMEGKQCVSLGIQIAQLADNIKKI